MQQYSELLGWWVVTISWSIVFLILVSIYLYGKKKVKAAIILSPAKVLRDFVFVWVLLALLLFYIVSISQRSSLLFAIGNIVVELILLLYIFKSKVAKRVI